MIAFDIIMILVALLIGGFFGRYVIPTRIHTSLMKKEIEKKEKRLAHLSEQLDNATRE